MAFFPGSDASVSHTVSQVPQLMQASVTMLGRRRTLTSKSPGCPVTRLDGGAPADREIGVVDGHVAVEALARARLGVAGGQALAAVVGGEHGADAGGAAAEEGPPLDELYRMTHLGELGGGLRAGHAAADDHDRVAALGVGHGVGRRVRVEHRRVDDPHGLVGHGRDVVAVDPAAALADVRDLQLEAAREELLQPARGEVRRAAGEDELPVAGLHQLAGAAPGHRGCTSGCRGARRRADSRAARAGRSRCS